MAYHTAPREHLQERSAKSTKVGKDTEFQNKINHGRHIKKRILLTLEEYEL